LQVDRVAQEFAPLGDSNLNTLDLLYAIWGHFATEYLQRTDLDRLVRSYIHAANGVGTLKGRGRWRAGDQQDGSEQKQGQSIERPLLEHFPLLPCGD
jgi:hypothetical protein